MPDFSTEFIKSKGEPILYEGKTLTLLDAFPVKDGDMLLASIESTHSDDKQGFFIDVTGHCELESEIFKHRKGVKMLFWENTAPTEIRLRVFTAEPIVWISNIWATTSLTGTRSFDYGRYGAAMIVEEIENGRRYRCNDWEPDDDFDDIVFTVRNLGQAS